MPTLTVYLGQADYDWVRQVARTEKKSVSALLAETIAVFRTAEKEESRGRK